MSDPVVELIGVSKTFGRQLAVDSLDLSVPRQSIYGFIGPNGSGKTTTLRMILRIHQPDRGVVRVLGAERGDAADERLGYLPEERGLYKRMTVRQVLRYFARLKGVRKPDPLIDEWLDRVQARPFAAKRIDQLSKGMAQKVQFIAAVIARPQLVILDEPFSGLDPVNMEVLRDAVIQLREAGTTIILSTHDMEIAQRLCDRVLMIYLGHKVLDGTLESIRQQHGDRILRVRLANGQPLPSDLPGVSDPVFVSGFHELRLSDGASRSRVLEHLARECEVEHFEVVRPSLHDIFVRIARPTEGK